MADLNRVFLLGRLTRDPTLRHTPGGTPVAEFGIAVNRTWNGPDGDRREETCFVDIVVWSRRAEICHANLSKASPVFVEGRLHLDTWSSTGGEKRSRLKVVANNVVFLNPPPRGGGGGRHGPQRHGGGRSSGEGQAPRKESWPLEPPPVGEEPPPAGDPPAPKPQAPGVAPQDAGPAPMEEAPPPEPDLPEPGASSDFPF